MGSLTGVMWFDRKVGELLFCQFELRFGVCMKMIAAVCAVLITCSALAQDPPSAASRSHIIFSVENHQVQPKAYSFVIYEDGSGSYRESPAENPVTEDAGGRSIHVEGALASEIFQAARAHHFFSGECETRQHDVAFTGKKTLAYAGPDGNGSCTFNYSRDQTLNKIASKLEAISYTLEEGLRLKSEQLHDRLSLDAELGSLQDAVRDQRAIELGNIAPELESIASDEAVMERARSRARSILAESATRR